MLTGSDILCWVYCLDIITGYKNVDLNMICVVKAHNYINKTPSFLYCPVFIFHRKCQSVSLKNSPLSDWLYTFQHLYSMCTVYGGHKGFVFLFKRQVGVNHLRLWTDTAPTARVYPVTPIRSAGSDTVCKPHGHVQGAVCCVHTRCRAIHRCCGRIETQNQNLSI